MSFLVSGLAGLSRMEWKSMLYINHSEVGKRKSFVKEAKSGTPFIYESGQLMTAEQREETIRTVEQRIEEATQDLKGDEALSEVKYWIHKWLFVAGLVLLIISRIFSLYLSRHATGIIPTIVSSPPVAG